MRSVSAAQAANDKFLIEGPGPKAWIHSYINEGKLRPDGTARLPGDASPMIYLVDQEPNSAIPMHFHQVDQFQIVIGGSGRIGRHPLAPVTVHYTNAHTGYGPLKSGPEGLQYLTIRNRWDPGLRPLPEARGELPKAGSYRARQRTTEPSPGMPLAVLGQLHEPNVRVLMDNMEGEARAWMVALPPGGMQRDPAHHQTDRAYVVVTGAIETEHGMGERLSCHFVRAGEIVGLRAKAAGADVLVLQFRSQ